MFGKRGDVGSQSKTALPVPHPAGGGADAFAGGAAMPNHIPDLNAAPAGQFSGQAARPGSTANPPPAPKAPKVDHGITSRKSENYYDIKSTIFNALIDAIDLTQLGQLDRDAARDEIRDIVNEIITLKDVVMSIAEQEELRTSATTCWAMVLSSRCWRAMTFPISW
jgi:pilus assembly protein CpaF